MVIYCGKDKPSNKLWAKNINQAKVAVYLYMRSEEEQITIYLNDEFGIDLLKWLKENNLINRTFSFVTGNKSCIAFIRRNRLNIIDG